MSADPKKLPDTSIRFSIDTDRNLPQGALPGTMTAQIQKLLADNQTLQREKDEIESKFSEKIETLESSLQIEKEKREEAEERAQIAEEELIKEKKEKMDIKVRLENENEIEKKLIEKENDRKQIELKLKYETEAKNDAISKTEKAERSKKTEIETV
ncbi:MAG: hypothetical protein EZS28_044958 [Streblomastix strix]|uniref:Uncharacterized protein n=1 Tax=Streblomastix strix TaxID=222440 RepID=A0A5J4TQ46_9EUKA|nr:MAG: hypothetical protein EZS28_044958 [Streblomastix strix]